MSEKAAASLVSFVIVISLIGFVDISGESAIAGTPISGTISANEVWTLAGSPYWIKGDITVSTGVTLTIDPGVQLRFDGFFELHINGNLVAVGSDSERIGITSNATSPAPEDWDMIFIGTSGHAEIVNCDITYSRKGIQLYSSNNVITNNTISFSKAEGIGISGSSDNDISYNNVTHNRYGILLYSSYNNSIKSNIVKYNHGSISIEKGIGIELESSNDNTIADNEISNNDGSGIGLTSSSNNTMINNEISSNEGGISLTSSSDNQLLGNSLVLNDYGIYIWLSSSNNMVISNSVFSNYVEGIAISSSSNRITANNVSENGYGITISSSQNCVDDNHLYMNDLDGIRIDSSSGQNTITGNRILKNGNGVTVQSSSQSIIRGNNISLNIEYGIKSFLSSNNRIYHNIISDNTNQVYTYMSANDWDDSYPSGGNYWGVYSSNCADEFNGVSTPQISGLHDGICDVPYYISSSSADYYPLKNPGLSPIDDTISPKASAGDNQSVPINTIVTFNGTLSDDNIGISNFTWTIEKDAQLIATLYGQIPSYEFEKPGNYIVTLTVRDYADNTDSETIIIAVEGEISVDISLIIIISVIILIAVALIFIIRRKRKPMNGIVSAKKQEEVDNNILKDSK
jgi:parallel beta-helix repeat protein